MVVEGLLPHVVQNSGSVDLQDSAAPRSVCSEGKHRKGDAIWSFVMGRYKIFDAEQCIVVSMAYQDIRRTKPCRVKRNRSCSAEQLGLEVRVNCNSVVR